MPNEYFIEFKGINTDDPELNKRRFSYGFSIDPFEEYLKLILLSDQKTLENKTLFKWLGDKTLKWVLGIDKLKILFANNKLLKFLADKKIVDILKNEKWLIFLKEELLGDEKQRHIAEIEAFKNKKNACFILADTLCAYNLAANMEGAKEFYKKCFSVGKFLYNDDFFQKNVKEVNEIGKKWIERSFLNNERLIRWDFWLKHPEYKKKLEFIEKLADTKADSKLAKGFRKHLDKSVGTYVKWLQDKEGRNFEPEEKQLYEFFSRNYFKEETAAYLLKQKYKFNYIRYKREIPPIAKFLYDNYINPRNSINDEQDKLLQPYECMYRSKQNLQEEQRLSLEKISEGNNKNKTTNLNNNTNTYNVTFSIFVEKLSPREIIELEKCIDLVKSKNIYQENLFILDDKTTLKI